VSQEPLYVGIDVSKATLDVIGPAPEDQSADQRERQRKDRYKPGEEPGVEALGEAKVSEGLHVFR